MNTQGDYQTKATLETFGFIPKLSAEDVQKQIAYMVANGWSPAIEHELPENKMEHYWTMWKLPFFGETNMANILAELEACRRTYPDHNVRLIGYDPYTQSQPVCFVVYEG